MTALAVLTVLAVLESALPSFCLSYKIFPFFKLPPLNPTPLFRDPEIPTERVAPFLPYIMLPAPKLQSCNTPLDVLSGVKVLKAEAQRKRSKMCVLGFVILELDVQAILNTHLVVRERVFWQCKDVIHSILPGSTIVTEIITKLICWEFFLVMFLPKNAELIVGNFHPVVHCRILFMEFRSECHGIGERQGGFGNGPA